MKQNGVCNFQENFGKWTTNLVLRVREKGSERINSVRQQLNVDIVTHPEQTVHQICRRDHCHNKDIRRQKRNRNSSIKITSKCFLFQRTVFILHKANKKGRKQTRI